MQKAIAAKGKFICRNYAKKLMFFGQYISVLGLNTWITLKLEQSNFEHARSPGSRLLARKFELESSKKNK